MTPEGALLELERLSVLRGDRRVVGDVSLSLSAGTLCALVGPNGAGKSSLLFALVAAIEKSAGCVRVGPFELDALSSRERARLITLVGAELGDGSALTAREVVELGRLPHLSPLERLGAEDERQVEQALSAMECSELEERPLSCLSMGERQRVHLARAIAQQPRVLLFDEAAAHLDLSHREETLGHLRRFARSGRVVLAVLHDLDLALRHCDRTAVLEQGRLVAFGRTEEVLRPELLATVFRVRAAVLRDESGTGLRIFGAVSRGAATPTAVGDADRENTGEASENASPARKKVEPVEELAVEQLAVEQLVVEQETRA